MSAPARSGPFYRRAVEAFARIEDGAILRFAFFGLLAGTLAVLFVDFRELSASQPDLTFTPQPILPPASLPGEGSSGPRPAITTPTDALEAPLEIELGPAGELHLTGTISVGSAVRFAEEVEARGEYIETVVLDSPGGSVLDALEIGALIREKGLATKVADGSLCASSCPLVFAAGAERIAGRDAAIGVHQIYAAALSAQPLDALATAGVAMSDAQAMTARITRHLTDSGVDAALWLHALETPPDALYYFTVEEMERLALVTVWDDVT